MPATGPTTFPSEEVGPLIGVRDARNPEASDPRLATAAVNMLRDEVLGLVGRPSLVAGGPAAAQWFGEHEYVDSVGISQSASFKFVAGVMYLVPWVGANVNVTPAGPVIDAAARIYCCSFANYLIVNDGINRPWAYNPVSGAGTVITMDPAAGRQIAYGYPEVRSGKLFFILSIDRQTIIWSEEGDPFTGYTQATYTNDWLLAQTSRAPLERLIATNTALVYFRRRGFGVVWGEVNEDFSTASTHDEGDDTLGLMAPGAALRVRDDIWFRDRDTGRPYVFTPGGGAPVPVWQDCNEQLNTSVAFDTEVKSGTAEAWAAYVPAYELVVFSLASITPWKGASAGGGTAPGMLLVYHVPSRKYLGIWVVGDTAGYLTLGATVRRKDAAGYSRQTLALFSANDSALYLHDERDAYVVTDAAAARPRRMLVDSPYLGVSRGTTKHFTQAEFYGAEPGAAATGAVSFSYRSSRGGNFQYCSCSVTPSGDTDGEYRAVVGINATDCRYVVLRAFRDGVARLAVKNFLASGVDLGTGNLRGR